MSPTPSTPPRGAALDIRRPHAMQAVPGDLVYVEDVVRVNFPVQAARTYLRRHMGNLIRFRLVEAVRGELVGHVRAAEVHPAAGGEPMFIRCVRLLPDGSPASHFVPDTMVVKRTEVVTSHGGAPFQLTPKDIILLHVPVRSYLRYLPGIYQGAVPAARRDIVRADEVSLRRWGQKDEVQETPVRVDNTDQMRRFLLLFHHLMTTVLDRVDQIPSLTDPITAEPKFLPWIASWVNFDLDASLPIHQQRELVRRAIRLYRNRGTRLGVEEMVRVLTSVPVRIIERQKPDPMRLGTACLAGGATVADRYLRKEPSAAFLAQPERPATRYFVLQLESRERFERRFGERAPEVLKRICRVVTTEKPAHVSFIVQFQSSDHA